MRCGRRRQAGCTLCLVLASVVAVNCQDGFLSGVRICARSSNEYKTCKKLTSIPPLDRSCPDSSGRDASCLSYRCLLRQDCAKSLFINDTYLAVMDPVSMFAYHSNVPPNSDHDIKLAMTEVHGSPQNLAQSCGANCPSSLFAVAVVRAATCAANPGLTLAATKGWTSCHGEYGDLAGWVLPLTQLQTQGLVANTGNDVSQMQTFYPQMCAPSGVDGLGVCTGCRSTDLCSTDNAYFGPAGVLQCLTDGGTSTVGFIDNYSLLTADVSQYSNVSTDTASTLFRILTINGCQNITSYYSPGYSMGSGSIPPDALVTTFVLPPDAVDGIRADFSVAAQNPAFQYKFSFDNNTDEYMFSQGTSGLANTTLDVPGFLGWLSPVLASYVKIAVNPLAQGYLTDLTIGKIGTNFTTTEESTAVIVGSFFGGLGTALLCCCLGVMFVACLRRRRGTTLRTRELLSNAPIPNANVPSLEVRPPTVQTIF